MALPQATVQLQNTQQLGSPAAPALGTIGTIATADDEEHEESDLIPTIFSILGFVVSLGVLALALVMWTTENDFGGLFK